MTCSESPHSSSAWPRFCSHVVVLGASCKRRTRKALVTSVLATLLLCTLGTPTATWALSSGRPTAPPETTLPPETTSPPVTLGESPCDDPVTVVEYSTCQTLGTLDQVASFVAVFLWASLTALVSLIVLLVLRRK